VARAEDEQRWLELGRLLPMRELERRVAGQVGGKKVCDSPAEVRWRTPETVELRMNLPAEVWALVSRAMQGARLAAEAPLSDAEALEAMAREALAGLCQPDSTSIADPRRAVVLYQCRDCHQTELETTAGAVALPPGPAARLTCGAKLIDLATEGFAEQCVGGTMPAAVRRAVLARDRGRCRICGRRRYVDVHHLEPQSEGGAHSRRSCCCLCTTCHAALHEGKLRITGDAEGALRWFDESGCELGAEADDADEADEAGEASGTGLPQARGPSAEATRGPSAEATRGPSAEAAQVLRAMAGRGGWSTDALVETTGLRVSEVLVALTELELGAQVRLESPGTFAPAGSSLARDAGVTQLQPHSSTTAGQGPPPWQDVPIGTGGPPWEPQNDGRVPIPSWGEVKGVSACARSRRWLRRSGSGLGRTCQRGCQPGMQPGGPEPQRRPVG
jgi:hypothetical protein